MLTSFKSMLPATLVLSPLLSTLPVSAAQPASSDSFPNSAQRACFLEATAENLTVTTFDGIEIPYSGIGGSYGDELSIQDLNAPEVTDAEPVLEESALPTFNSSIAAPISGSETALVTTADEWAWLMETATPPESPNQSQPLVEALQNSAIFSVQLSAGHPQAESCKEDATLDAAPIETEGTSASPIAPIPDLGGDATGGAEPISPAPLPDVPTVPQPAPADVLAPTPPGSDPTNYTPQTDSPTPFDGVVPTTLATLPDGSYRYVAGTVEERAYSDDELLDIGGSVFLLTKVGSAVVGNLMPRLGEPTMCLVGRVEGNLITGSAYPMVDPSVEETDIRQLGDEYAPYGSGALQIRQTTVAGDRAYYAGARLDLDRYTRINAGSAIAPVDCEGAVDAAEVAATESEVEAE